MSPLELIGSPQSVFVRTTRMAMEEKGVAYSLTPASPHSPRVDALNPFGRIPVLRHGDFVLFESKAIATYIDRQFPGPGLLPQCPRQAAIAEQWISAINTSVFAALAPYMQENAFPKGAHGSRNERLIEEQLPVVVRHINILNSALVKSPHLSGDSFTLADMYLLPLLSYLMIFPESQRKLCDAESLFGYFSLHSQRNSFTVTTPPPLIGPTAVSR